MARALVWGVDLLLRAFFRRVEVVGAEQLPPAGEGGVLVTWHPNGLLDPAVLLTQFPHTVVFGARHGLFRWPLLGALMRSLGTAPIYRSEDSSAPERHARNAESLGALADAVASGRVVALFPEGVSHDAPHLQALRTGAARLFFAAAVTLRAAGVTAGPHLLPVGLYYNRKRAFRSEALVSFLPPMKVDDLLDAYVALRAGDPESEESKRALARTLTERISTVLTEIVFSTEDWEEHRLMHRARKLVRIERGLREQAPIRAPTMEERQIGFARVHAGYHAARTRAPEPTARLRARLADYDANLRALGLEDHELDQPLRLWSWGVSGTLLLQALMIYVLLPPILPLGYLVSGPPALFLKWVARRFSAREKDEATVKLLGGIILFPLAWLTAASIAAFASEELHRIFASIPRAPIASGVSVGCLSAIGAVVAYQYLTWSRQTVRALRVGFTRARRRSAVTHLRRERSALYEQLMRIAEGLDLPESL